MRYVSAPDGNAGEAFTKVGVVVKRESRNRTRSTTAIVERPADNALDEAEEMPRFTARVRITVTSYRKAVSDTEGVSVKAFLDGLVARGILANDTCKEVKKVEFETIVVGPKGEEKTVLEITDG